MPGISCAYRPCPTKSGDGISLFTFPKELESAKQWAEACNRSDMLSKQIYAYRLCELHFEEKCFSKAASARKRLLPDAVPTIFLNNPRLTMKASEVDTEKSFEVPSKKIKILEGVHNMDRPGGAVCAAKNCRNKQYNCSKRFFSFPKDRDRAVKWAIACNREELLAKQNLHKSHRLCSDHFDRKMFTNHFCNRLNIFAVPTKFSSSQDPSDKDHNYSHPELIVLSEADLNKKMKIEDGVHSDDPDHSYSYSDTIVLSDVKCPICEEEIVLNSHEDLQIHLIEFHHIHIDPVVTLEFSNNKEFEIWKSKEKIDVNYAMNRLNFSPEHKTMYYGCNRSDLRIYKSNDKIKSENPGGNNIGVCPSRLVCKLYDEGQVSVSFWKTHAGHEEDIQRKQISKLQKKEMVEEMQVEEQVTSEISKDSEKVLGTTKELVGEDAAKLLKEYISKNEHDQNSNGKDDFYRFQEGVTLMNIERKMESQKLQSFLEELDDDSFKNFMKDIQGTIKKYKRKNKITKQQKIQQEECIASNKWLKIVVE